MRKLILIIFLFVLMVIGVQAGIYFFIHSIQDAKESEIYNSEMQDVPDGIKDEGYAAIDSDIMIATKKSLPHTDSIHDAERYSKDNTSQALNRENISNKWRELPLINLFTQPEKHKARSIGGYPTEEEFMDWAKKRQGDLKDMLDKHESGSIDGESDTRLVRTDSGKEKIEEGKAYLENLGNWRMEMLEARREAMESGDFSRINRLKQERPRPSF